MINGSKELKNKYSIDKADVKEIADTIAQNLKAELKSKISLKNVKVRFSLFVFS